MPVRPLPADAVAAREEFYTDFHRLSAQITRTAAAAAETPRQRDREKYRFDDQGASRGPVSLCATAQPTPMHVID